MALILALEADRKQASRLTALAKDFLKAELIIGNTTDDAFAQLSTRRPDLILTSLLLSPKDETALASRLRDLDDAGWRVHTLVIPVLAGKSKQAKSAGGGLLNRLRRGSAPTGKASTGCDPAVFAAQIEEYLDRAAADRALALEDEQLDVLTRPASTPEPVVEPDQTDEAFERTWEPAAEERSLEPAASEAWETTTDEVSAPEPAAQVTVTWEPAFAQSYSEPAETPQIASAETAEIDTPQIVEPHESVEELPLNAEPALVAEAAVEPEPAYTPEPADTPEPAYIPEPAFVTEPAPAYIARSTFEPSDLLPEIDFELPEVEIISEPSPDEAPLEAPDSQSTPDQAADSAWQTLTFEPEIAAPAPLAAASVEPFSDDALATADEADMVIQAEPIDLAKFLAELTVVDPLPVIITPPPAPVFVAPPVSVAPPVFVVPPVVTPSAPAPVMLVDQPPARPAFLDQPPTALRVRWAWPQLEGAALDADLAAFVSDEPADEVAVALIAAMAASVEAANGEKRSHSKKSAKENDRKKKKSLPPPQDEWGFFDPNQCGFAALVAKLDEIAKEEASSERK